MASRDYGSRAPLGKRRVPYADVVLGRTYLIHASNGGVGVAVRARGWLGFRLRREKVGRVHLFVEYDFDECEPDVFDPDQEWLRRVGTAIPLRELVGEAPAWDEDALLAYLEELEELHRHEIEANWRTVRRLKALPPRPEFD